MARIDFIKQAKALGVCLQEPDGSRICFEFEVPVGRNFGKKVLIGFEVHDDFPMNSPRGPHFKSVSISGWVEPPNNIHASPFGSEWRYWSRPFPDWNRTDKTVKTYMSHIRNLLAKV